MRIVETLKAIDAEWGRYAGAAESRATLLKRLANGKHNGPIILALLGFCESSAVEILHDNLLNMGSGDQVEILTELKKRGDIREDHPSIKQAIEMFTNALASQYSSERREALQVAMLFPRHFPDRVLVPVLDDLDPENARLAAGALASASWQPIDRNEKARWAVAAHDWSTAVSCGDASIQPLRNRMGSLHVDQLDLIPDIVEVLWKIHTNEAIEVILDSCISAPTELLTQHPKSPDKDIQDARDAFALMQRARIGAMARHADDPRVVAWIRTRSLAWIASSASCFPANVAIAELLVGALAGTAGANIQWSLTAILDDEEVLREIDTVVLERTMTLSESKITGTNWFLLTTDYPPPLGSWYEDDLNSKLLDRVSGELARRRGKR